MRSVNAHSVLPSRSTSTRPATSAARGGLAGIRPRATCTRRGAQGATQGRPMEERRHRQRPLANSRELALFGHGAPSRHHEREEATDSVRRVMAAQAPPSQSLSHTFTHNNSQSVRIHTTPFNDDERRRRLSLAHILAHPRATRHSTCTLSKQAVSVHGAYSHCAKRRW